MSIIKSFILILLSISLTAFSQKKKIELGDVAGRRFFVQKNVTGLRSMNDGMNYTTQENETKIVKYSYKTGSLVEVLFDLSKVENPGLSVFSDYAFSNDETKILFTTNQHSLYRHSFTADFYIWNLTTKEMTPLSANGPQQLATFSPDGERVAFVRNYNIFIKSLKFGTENQATRDGKKNEIINGAPDWVYEEEFSFNKAFEWSPDSKFLAFIKFNETEVPMFNIPMYQGQKPELNENQLYPGNYSYKYPKAGEKNSVVSVLVYDLKAKSSVTAEVGTDQEQYIPRIKWTADASDLAIMKLNRLQKELDIVLCNPYTRAGVQFDMAVYTNRNHGIRGGNTSMHLYTKMTNYLKEKLQ